MFLESSFQLLLVAENSLSRSDAGFFLGVVGFREAVLRAQGASCLDSGCRMLELNVRLPLIADPEPNPEALN